MTTKIYDGKILASAVTTGLGNFLEINCMHCYRGLILYSATQTLIPTPGDLQCSLMRHTQIQKLITQHFISSCWWRVSEPTIAAFWDIKWLLTYNDSEGQGVQGDESQKSNGLLGPGKTGPAARVNISHLSSSGYRSLAAQNRTIWLGRSAEQCDSPS